MRRSAREPGRVSVLLPLRGVSQLGQRRKWKERKCILVGRQRGGRSAVRRDSRYIRSDIPVVIASTPGQHQTDPLFAIGRRRS